jgi:hypothetical protein
MNESGEDDKKCKGREDLKKKTHTHTTKFK